VLITISRQTGSLGQEITDLLAKNLDIPVLTREMAMNQWFPEVAGKHELHMLHESPAFYHTLCSQGITFAEFLENKLRDYAAQQSAIIFGMGAQIIFADHPQALHAKIIASHEVRTARVMRLHSLAKTDAERFMELTDRKHKRYVATVYNRDWADPTLYHITLNTDHMSVEEGTDLLAYFAQSRQTDRLSEAVTEQANDKPVVFKHPSEEEFAQILDMHDIEWEYEPRTFPIKWDEEGHVIQAFSPDFYLPRFNNYIELTTMDQRYTAAKKKKVELLKKLYPGTNISIVYKNDFYSLVERFGLRKGSD